jgi:hypothetical protein
VTRCDHSPEVARSVLTCDYQTKGMRELTTILAAATEAIEPVYFLLPIADDDPIYRERVYCYELYHQMCCRWPVDCRYCLNGELNKAGHRIMNARGVRSSPDLLTDRQVVTPTCGR